MRMLFICNQNLHRSKTAEDFFRGKFDTRSAGLFNDNPVTESDLSWADSIVVMEDRQRSILAERFPSHYLKKRIISLDIPDVFRRNQPELINLLKECEDLL